MDYYNYPPPHLRFKHKIQRDTCYVQRKIKGGKASNITNIPGQYGTERKEKSESAGLVIIL